jgi:hypothetical protein
MVLEMLIIFSLERPLWHLPKAAITMSDVVDVNYSKKDGLTTSWDEPAKYMAEHPSVTDWFGQWKAVLDEEKNKSQDREIYGYINQERKFP